MKKIIVSLAIVAAVATVAVGATMSYFNDTETSAGNTISAGTIDISVDGQNPWQKTYTKEWTDFKPGVTQYIQFTVTNEGKNPVVLRKQIGNFVVDASAMNEPKCKALQGTWTEGHCSAVVPPTDFGSKMVYDMTVTPEGGSPITVINESWGVTMADVNGLWVPLGAIEPGKTLVVKQSYTLDPKTGNEYQGDTMAFDISLYAEQKDGPGPDTTTGVVLDNKDTTSGTWYSVVDGTLGLLTWDGSGNYRMRAWGLAGAQYRAVYYDGTTEHDLGAGLQTPVSGHLDFTGTYGSFGTNHSAKYWLRDSGYDNAKTLWEGNLVNQ
ncbi:MAG: CalY family protein [Patescibacteria group bacterium]|nr:CalY family protein [Patescibacteria group bacterium]